MGVKEGREGEGRWRRIAYLHEQPTGLTEPEERKINEKIKKKKERKTKSEKK